MTFSVNMMCPLGSVPVSGGACSAELAARESGFEKHSETQPDVIVEARRPSTGMSDW